MYSFLMLLELRVMQLVVTTWAIRHPKLQSNRHHQQTNTQSFYKQDALPVAQQKVSALKGIFCNSCPVYIYCSGPVTTVLLYLHNHTYVNVLMKNGLWNQSSRLLIYPVWPSGWDAGLAINRSRFRIPTSPLSSATLGKLLTQACLCHQAV